MGSKQTDQVVVSQSYDAEAASMWKGMDANVVPSSWKDAILRRREGSGKGIWYARMVFAGALRNHETASLPTFVCCVCRLSREVTWAGVIARLHEK